MVDLSKQRDDFRAALVDLLNHIYTEGSGGGGYPDITASRFHLIGMVKIKIDEMMPEGEGVQFEVQDLENTTDTLDLAINALLDASAKQLYQIADKSYINGTASTNPAVPLTGGVGYVLVPDDFIRLKSFKLTLWEREVTEPITIHSPLYDLQRNKYSRGGKSKPVCVIKEKVVSSAIKRIMEYYSLDEGDTHTVEEYFYIKEVPAEDVQENMKESLTWLCAAKILEVTGRQEASKGAYEQFTISLENLK